MSHKHCIELDQEGEGLGEGELCTVWGNDWELLSQNLKEQNLTSQFFAFQVHHLSNIDNYIFITGYGTVPGRCKHYIIQKWRLQNHYLTL